MSEHAKMRTVQVRVTWESRHTLRLPVGAEVPPTLDELMELVRADPKSAGDLTTANAEPLDWTWRR